MWWLVRGGALRLRDCDTDRGRDAWYGSPNRMRARPSVLWGQIPAWEAGPRSAAELREAATHFERAAALHPAPAMKDDFANASVWCRHQAEAL